MQQEWGAIRTKIGSCRQGIVGMKVRKSGAEGKGVEVPRDVKWWERLIYSSYFPLILWASSLNTVVLIKNNNARFLPILVSETWEVGFIFVTDLLLVAVCYCTYILDLRLYWFGKCYLFSGISRNVDFNKPILWG